MPADTYLRRLWMGISILCSVLVLTAQVPYEYFKIEFIAPPGSSTDRRTIPRQPPVPHSLYLDGETSPGVDLSLSEPFTPPAGIYKRIAVLSKIVEKQTDHGMEYYVEEDPEAVCRPVRLQKPPASHALHRSALVYVDFGTADEIEIPSDSPEMWITSYKATPLVDPESPAPRLYHCSDSRYVVSGGIGSYRLEYETASPADYRPRPAAFFSDLDPEKKDILPSGMRKRLMRIFSSSRRWHSKIPECVDTLIVDFQNYESAPLESSMPVPEGSRLIGRILDEQKGVCRHRAYLFMHAASLMNYKTRIVLNEIHAFVEIFHHGHWYPVELGGDAGFLRIEPTSLTLPVSVSHHYSFFEAPALPHGDQGSDDVRGVSGRTEKSGNLEAVREDEEIRFEPEIGFPVKILRGQSFTIRGKMRRQDTGYFRNTSFQLIITASDGSRAPIVLPFTTDESGMFELQIVLPVDWPVGMSESKWRKVP